MNTLTGLQSPAWLDRMYDNRALVPEHVDVLARWARSSCTVRRALSCQLDVAYGDAERERLDVFAASPIACTTPPDSGTPVLVFIHGGYWRALDKADHAFMAPAFTQAGACVVLPNYTLCPAASVPAITVQLVKALAWTWRHIAEHGGDPSRITVVGHSAGGHLAAMLLTCRWRAYAPELPPDLLKNALSISGLYELEPLRHAPFLKDALQLTPDQVQRASPARLPAPAGRLYSVVGSLESEEFLRQNALIRQVWGRSTVPVCESLAGLNHFTVLDALADPGHRLHGLSLELLGLASMV